MRHIKQFWEQEHTPHYIALVLLVSVVLVATYTSALFYIVGGLNK